LLPAPNVGEDELDEALPLDKPCAAPSRWSTLRSQEEGRVSRDLPRLPPLRNIKPVISFISNGNDLVARPAAESGRSPKEWLNDHELEGHTDEYVVKVSALYMTAARVFL